MKKILLGAAYLCGTLFAHAQQKEGKVVYERVSVVQVRFNDMPGGAENAIPRTRTNKFELSFGNNQSLYKAAESDNEDNSLSGGEGVQVRMIVAGIDDIVYNNLETGKRVEKREVFDKTFVIEDSITKLKWKMTGETKDILGYPVMKATTSRISSRMQMSMDNGKMERKEVWDTSAVVAWFTTSIPVSTGPGEFSGQLPGLILELDIANGRQVYKAISVDKKADLALIKEPSGKKRMTPEEFRTERNKMMEEMQKNNQGGNRVIRMQ